MIAGEIFLLMAGPSTHATLRWPSEKPCVCLIKVV